MFGIILKNEINNDTILKKIKAYFNRKKFYVNLNEGKEFKYVQIEIENPNFVNWEQVKSVIGKLSSRLIIGDGIGDIRELGFREIDTLDYSHRVTLNTLDYILSRLGNSLESLKTTLVDIRGVYLDYAKILTKYSSRLKVITKRSDVYDDFAENMLNEMGSVVIITDSFSNLPDNKFIVSPNCEILKFENYFEVPVISCIECESNNKNIFHSFRTELLDEFKDTIPSGIDKHKYQSALYEYCKVKELDNCIANECKYFGNKISVDDLICILFGIDIEIKS